VIGAEVIRCTVQEAWFSTLDAACGGNDRENQISDESRAPRQS
jgi:hypothetical protein